MEPLIQLTVLTAATALAAGSAIALNWIFLRTAFRLMQPAGASSSKAAAASYRPSVRSELVQGTRASAQQFVLHR